MSADVYEVTMPKLGETVTEGVVSQWLKQVGDTVAFDDPLFEVSTDKVDSEVPSPYDGVLLEILVNAGDTVPIGTPIARIGEPGAAAAPGSAPPAGPAKQVSETNEPATELAAVTTPPAGNGQSGVLLSPVVRRMAAEKGIDLTAVPGSGAGGRIRREDVEHAIAAQPAAAAPATAAAAPSATVPAPAPVVAAPRPAVSVSPGDEVVKLSRMRLITADLMVRSLKTSAHVWTSVEVDFEHVEQVRTIDGEVGKTVALDGDRAEIEELPGLAGIPQPDFLALRLAGKRLQLLADAERIEHPRAVRGELHARADFLELRGLLVDLDINARAEQRERGGEPADAAPCDEYAWHSGEYT